MSSGKWRRFCLGLDVLTRWPYMFSGCISMGKAKKNVTPLLTRSALTDQYVVGQDALVQKTKNYLKKICNRCIYWRLGVYSYRRISDLSLQLSCGDTCQILMWFEESNMYFCEIENFACGKLTNWALETPIPGLNSSKFDGVLVYVTGTYMLWRLISSQLDCMVNSFFWLTTTKTQNLHITGQSWSIQPVTWAFTTRRALVGKMFPCNDVIL